LIAPRGRALYLFAKFSLAFPSKELEELLANDKLKINVTVPSMAFFRAQPVSTIFSTVKVQATKKCPSTSSPENFLDDHDCLLNHSSCLLGL